MGLRDAHALSYWSQHTQERVERVLRLPYVKDAPATLDGTSGVIKIALWTVSAKIKLLQDLVVLLLCPTGKILHYCDCHVIVTSLDYSELVFCTLLSSQLETRNPVQCWTAICYKNKYRRERGVCR